jgi:farnesyl-diphosphate farnesyltransferase
MDRRVMFRAVPDRSLDEILSKVSRSFYLSLAILPRAMRSQLSAAYLVARAADTIADTRLVQAERRIELLDGMKRALVDPETIAPYVSDVGAQLMAPEAGVDETSAAERLLLTRLGDCLRRLGDFEEGDRDRARKVLETLIAGMERDLSRFSDAGKLVALETVADLDEYTYMAAGCVGEYWTVMTAAHVPTVRRLARPDFVARGVRLGKALQLVNVIRDAAADLAQGRCYVPRAMLAAHGLAPEDLRDPQARRRARPLLDELRVMALGHIDAAFPYVMAIPRREPRLRLAALWPLWIGLGTLEKLAAADDPLDPARAVKISRADVYKILAESSMTVGVDRALTRLHERRRRRAE